MSQGKRFLPKLMRPGVFRSNLGEIGHYGSTADSDQIRAVPISFCVAYEPLLAWGITATASAIMDLKVFRM